ncbi:uncharacterized protein [Gossypium hirsutum]|uniref:Uncharacterized protein isoform X1 n=1 Tax=Gossypium hirsutum TaxID=3635 RepID=A0ABM2ZWQ2_GOSHI|nr:uncharacterized protein LOC107898919 isoform X1 [Gossypium hirsutum]
MASTSGTVINGLGSSFLCGGNRSQALWGASSIGPIVATPAATRKRKLIVVAAAPPKKSWLPAVKGGGNLVDPEWLDGSSRQGPNFPQMVQRSRADPRTLGHDRRGRHLHRPSLEWCTMVRGRSRPRCNSPILLRLTPWHPTPPHGLGGEQAMGRLFQPKISIRRMGNSMVENSRELRQRHRPAGLPVRQVLRPIRPCGYHPKWCLHPRL